MTQPPKDDKDLINFLQRYRPQPPPAAPGLEDQILNAIEQSKVRSLPRQQWYRSAWVPMAIAATLVAGLFSHRLLTPVQPNPTEVAALETFMQNSWDVTVNDSPEDDWSMMASR